MKKLLLFVVLLLMVAYWRNELLYVLQINRLNTLSAQQRQKIWVHRVNSLERMHWVKDDFKGIEFDVYFDVKKKEFTVAHPPEDTAGPSLSAFFRELCYTNLFGWVDVKALKKEDLQEALAALEKLNTFCSIRNRLLFEHKIFTGVAGSNTIRMLPSLALRKEEADIFLEALVGAVNDLVDRERRGGRFGMLAIMLAERFGDLVQPLV